MNSSSTSETHIRSEAEALDDGLTEVQIRLAKIRRSMEEEREWREQAMKALDIYEGKKKYHYNIFYANVETTAPALYNSSPVPNVSQRWEVEPEPVEEEQIVQEAQQQGAQLLEKARSDSMLARDADGGAARMQAAQQQAAGLADQLRQQAEQAAQAEADKQSKLQRRATTVIERGLVTQIDLAPFDAVMRQTAKVLETTGRGVPRIRFKDDEPDDNEAGQRVEPELVHWEDFGRGPARQWEKVPFVWFRHYLTLDECAKLIRQDLYERHDKIAAEAQMKGVETPPFNEEEAELAIRERLRKLAFLSDGSVDTRKAKSKEDKGVLNTVEVFEFWDKADRNVWWISEHDQEVPLATVPDPLGLSGFFPVPKPAQRALSLAHGLVPVCPLSVYGGLLDELEEVSKRIRGVMKGMKVRGYYDPKIDKAMETLKRLKDGEYAPAQNTENFTTGGGSSLDDLIHHFPLEPYAVTLRELKDHRNDLLMRIYEVTGISDIMRGATDPNETAHAQEIKATQGSQRLRDGQSIVEECARDLVAMMGEIMCTKFSRETLEEMTSMRISDELEAFMRDRALRTFKIDIETKSTIRADEAVNSQMLSNFLTATSQYVTTMAPMIEMMPGSGPPAIELYGAFVRKMNLGKSVEDILEKFVDAAMEHAQNPPADGPSQEEMAMERERLDMERQDKEAQREHDKEMAGFEKDKIGKEMERDDKKFQMEAHAKEQEIGFKREEHQMKMQQAGMKMEADAHGLEMKAQTEQVKAESAVNQASLQGKVAEMKAAIDIDSSQRKAAHDEKAAELQLNQQKQMGEMKVSDAKRMGEIKAKQAAKPKPAARHRGASR